MRNKIKKVVDLESNLKKEVKKNDILSEKINKMETTQKDYESKSFKCAQYDQNYVTYVENCLKVRKKWRNTKILILLNR